MLKTLVCLFMLLGSSQTDTFKKEAKVLEPALDGIVNSTGARITQSSKAALIDRYGVFLTVEMAFEEPSLPPPFGPPVNAVASKAAVAQRTKGIKDKVTAFVTERVTKLESVGPDESFIVVIRIFNTNPAILPDLPTQFTFSTKKQSPSQVTFREF